MNLFGDRRTLADKLIDYFKSGADPSQLPGKLREEWEIIDTADNLIKTHVKLSTVVPLLLQKYKWISQSTAYRYCALAQSVLGSMPTMHKEYWRPLMFEQAKRDHEFAKKLQDGKAMNMATANMIKILQLDRPDEVAMDPSKIQQHNNLIVFMDAGKVEKQLTIKEIQNLPEAQRNSIIERIVQAMEPEEITFTDEPNGLTNTAD